MRSQKYIELLELLHKHPEFDGCQCNPCDDEIIKLGKELWASFDKNRKVEDMTQTEKTVVFLLKKGVSPQNISNGLEIGLGAIYGINQRFGVNYRKVSDVEKQLGSEKDEIIEKLVSANFSVEGLARMCNLSRTSVSNYLDKNGISARQLKKEYKEKVGQTQWQKM